MKKTPILIAALGITLIAGLAGCTNTATTTDAASKSPTPSASSTPDAKPAAKNTCVDGEATLVGPEKTISLPDGCDTVYVLTDNATIDLGPTKKLFFEGGNNKVTHTGAAPEVKSMSEPDTNKVTAK